jgi:hypothetical protein
MCDLFRRVQAAALLHGYSLNPAYAPVFAKGLAAVQDGIGRSPKLFGPPPEIGRTAENLVQMMMVEARARDSRVLTLADLESACGKLGYSWAQQAGAEA